MDRNDQSLNWVKTKKWCSLLNELMQMSSRKFRSKTKKSSWTQLWISLGSVGKRGDARNALYSRRASTSKTPRIGLNRCTVRLICSDRVCHLVHNAIRMRFLRSKLNMPSMAVHVVVASTGLISRIITLRWTTSCSAPKERRTMPLRKMTHRWAC